MGDLLQNKYVNTVKMKLQAQFLTLVFSRKFSTSWKFYAKLEVLPKRSLVDERLQATIISNLKPHSSVTLKILVSNHENLHFSSKVRLKADSSGLVDLTKSLPRCGAYQVPDLMALYWKMDYQKGSDKRFWPLNVDKSLECTYQVYQNENETELLAEEKFFRDFVKSGVQRISIKTGKIRGTLFLPTGNGPYPAVINIYGGLNKGKIIEDKSAVFASRGIASLALAFFGVDGLPTNYDNENLEISYFEEAVDFLLSHPKIEAKKGIGVCGLSKGASIALAMAAT